jgi:hypothetical protein
MNIPPGSYTESSIIFTTASKTLEVKGESRNETIVTCDYSKAGGSGLINITSGASLSLINIKIILVSVTTKKNILAFASNGNCLMENCTVEQDPSF